MKKLFYLFAALILTSAVHAQDLSVSLKTGVCFSNVVLEGQQQWTANNRTGFQLGIGFEYETMDKVFFSPEINFAKKGTVYVWDRTSADDEYTFNLNYIDIPLIMKYRIETGVFNFTFGAGPYLSFLAGGTVDDVGVSGGSNIKEWEVNDYFESNYKDYNKLDLGIDFDFGAEVPLLSGFLTLEYRLGLGFMKIAEADTENTPYKDLSNFRVSTLLLGYRFEL